MNFEILKIGKIILSNRKLPSLRTKEILTQVNNTQKSGQQNSKFTEKIPLTEGDQWFEYKKNIFVILNMHIDFENLFSRHAIKHQEI